MFTQIAYGDNYLSEIQHPFLSAIHPWLGWLALLSAVLAIAIFATSIIDYYLVDLKWSGILGSIAIISFLAYMVLDPALEPLARATTIASLLTFIFGGLALGAEFFWHMPSRPFFYLAGAAFAVTVIGKLIISFQSGITGMS